MGLRKYRKILGLSQWDVSRASGICQTKISLLERGFVKASEADKQAIAEALFLDVADAGWLFEEKSDEQRMGQS